MSAAAGKKIERKYLAHYIDADFSGSKTDYVRLGKDLEDYSEDMGPDVEIKMNIWCEQNVNHKGYSVQSEIESYYAYYDEPLFEQLAKIANERLNGDDCKTTKVDVLASETGTVLWAYREDVYLVPTKSPGGDTSGVQIPFTIYNAGNRVKGTWDTSTKTFTPSTAASGE